MDVNSAILERLEKVVDKLQENSLKMGQLLAVHNEKLDKQDKVDEVLFEKIASMHRALDRESNLIKAGCERDIRKVDDRLRTMEKKMWSIFGGLSIISVIVSPIGQQMIKNLQPRGESVIINPTQIGSVEPSRQQIHISSLV
tara:strand:- start:3 stop:428 length:426 start_codon:yes stop_codon:yes gene_type:complete